MEPNRTVSTAQLMLAHHELAQPYPALDINPHLKVETVRYVRFSRVYRDISAYIGICRGLAGYARIVGIEGASVFVCSLFGKCLKLKCLKYFT